LLRDREDTAPVEGLRVDAIGGVLLISASGPARPGDAARLEEKLEQAGAGSRSVVVDFTAAGAPDKRMLDVLRAAWRRLGDRLRVVAPPGSPPAAALKHAGLRRFAVHASLSGAMTQAGGGRQAPR
jgi:hypothetical protein